jgi:hypothetical protein
MPQIEFGAFFNKFTPNRGNTRGSHDVVGEYAVYMMAKSARMPAKTAVPGGGAGANLDALPLSPYTSAVPWIGRDFEPRTAP